MILSSVSLVLLAYVLIRFVVPLRCGLFAKLLMAAALIAVSRKFQIYEGIGGSLFAPDLPRPFLIFMELSYAALLILALLLLARDMALLVLLLARRAGRRWRPPFSPDRQKAGLAVIALACGAFGVWQSLRVPDIRTVEVAVPHLPRELDGFSLVQLSDLHVGPLLQRDWLREVVKKTNALTPDLVLLTGDMIDGDPERLREEVQPLAGLAARHGVYGVAGNHEYYYGVRAWTSVFENLGVTMLCNEHRTIPVGESGIVIAGIADPAAAKFGETLPDAAKALEGAPETIRLLLAHQPGAASENREADLQLSGHTHGGTMFFLKPLVAAFNKGLVRGLYDRDGKQIYVSPGTGIWNGFSCRLGVPAEMTRIVLRTGLRVDPPTEEREHGCPSARPVAMLVPLSCVHPL